MRIAVAEGKDWQSEMYKFLIAYRSTPHEITGESPAKRMFRREIRTKLPEFHEQMCDTDQTARDRDAELKQRGKDYADRNARDSNIDTGDKVLLQQAKKDKLSTRYVENPLTVVDRTGSKVTVETEDGKRYVRNSAHLRKFINPADNDEPSDNLPVTQETDDISLKESVPSPKPVSIPDPEPPPGRVTRSGRSSYMPAKFNDFVL